MKVSDKYTYDSMGNILTLKRNGLQYGDTYGLVDNLTYTYNGNQLIKISDGGLMADICTGSDVQPYKYNGRNLTACTDWTLTTMGQGSNESLTEKIFK
ncbi:MAG: hypothetical protein Q4F85_09005 [Prevotella sp.]|nr:hypothetical protein [Prevotella sp.]